MDPRGRQLLKTRPLINSQTVDIEALSRKPANTFGYAYWRFLKDNQVSPNTRAPIKYIPTDDVTENANNQSQFTSDGELAYVILRYRQIHDFLHTLTGTYLMFLSQDNYTIGVPITVAGEIGLKWFEFFQFGLPMQLIAGVVGPLRVVGHSDEMLEYWTWAVYSGPNTEFLLNVPFEEMFDWDLDELRKSLNLLPFTSSGQRLN